MFMVALEAVDMLTLYLSSLLSIICTLAVVLPKVTDTNKFVISVLHPLQIEAILNGIVAVVADKVFQVFVSVSFATV